jgi:23S rRNA (uracil1939-C5)-methyltransferase
LTTRDIALKPRTTLRAGAELEVEFSDLLANGQAVGRVDGMVVFCFGPLPRERARVRIATVKPRYAVAEMVELRTSSPERAQPFCPVFGTCGGCQVQHLEYAAQLAWKREVLRNALQRIGGLEGTEVREPVGMSDPRAYRNKMSLVVDHHSASPTIGFYRQRSHEVVPIDGCPIVMPQLSAYVARLSELRAAGELDGLLRDAYHLVARGAHATGQAVLTVTTPEQSQAAQRAAGALMTALPGLVGVTNSFDLGSQNAIVGRRHRVMAGEAEIEEVIAGLRYRVSAGSFFQVNVEMVGRIFEFMQPRLKNPGNVVDLYCGAGTFALYFARHGCHVFGVEENAQAIAEAQANARLNELQQYAHFQTGRVEELVANGALQQPLREAELVFLDPPRKGCDQTALEAMAEAGVPEIWYLSCDPATLARDLKLLAAKAYRLRVVQPFDMFPQTGHVEALVQLECSDAGRRY